MKKWLIKLGALLGSVILLFTVFLSVSQNLPNPYEKTFLAEMNDKYDLLKKTNDKKIVFVGGSSLPFGLRSDIIEQELSDYKVINYGLYATLGTKFMVETSKVNISSGDIIVLAPEVASQTYSTFFNEEAILQACNGFNEMYWNLDYKEIVSLFYNYFKFSTKKINYSISGAPDPEGIYRHDSFNEYGDIAVERKNNIISNGVDTTTDITPNTELLNEPFIKMVNEYIKFVKSKGASIYFNYSPMNDLAIKSSKEKRVEFTSKINEVINCETLMNLEDCVLDYRYFYDTNYHLNSTGAINFTNHIVAALKDKLGIVHGEVVDLDPPPLAEEDVPDVPSEHIDFDEYKGEPNNEYLDYFEYRLVGSSYQIIGVKDEYKDMEKVILPAVYEDKNIKTIASLAFEGCTNLNAVYIGLNYSTIQGSAFFGCESLNEIHLFETNGNLILVPTTGLLDGCNEAVTIYVPKGSSYSVGYTWEAYSEYIVEREE